MDNKKLKTKILRWLCAKFDITNIGISNAIFYYAIQPKDELTKSYLFLKKHKSKDYDYIFANEHLDKLNAANAYEIKSLKPWQILDIFLDESSKGYSIYVLRQNLSSSFFDDEIVRTTFIESNSSLESLAIEMDLNSESI